MPNPYQAAIDDLQKKRDQLDRLIADLTAMGAVDLTSHPLNWQAIASEEVGKRQSPRKSRRPDPDAEFDPRGAVAFLIGLGHHLSPQSLAGMRNRGTGPKWHKNGGRVVYKKTALVKWGSSHRPRAQRKARVLTLKQRTPREPGEVLRQLDTDRHSTAS